MADYRDAPPNAAFMIEALRGIGYTTVTALADLIDNSISAQSTEIHIHFEWRGKNSFIYLMDNGFGMNAEEIDSAMRIGSVNPLLQRQDSDLGRFGLGLKTASFSQCRRLTVASKKKNSNVECLRWDLDVLSKMGSGWILLEGPNKNSIDLLSPLDNLEQGTFVLWESLDKIVVENYSQNDFLDLIDRVENYLGMIFHRYLSASSNNVKIYINDKKISSWDPFFLNHPRTLILPEYPTCLNGLKSVKAYILPHENYLTPKEFQIGAGPSGWISQQGFYVYRNKRLLVSGGWLNLRKGWSQDQAHQLVRIKVDMVNSADSTWKIDIKKSSAQPPVEVRKLLGQIAQDAREKGYKVFTSRSQYTKRSQPEKNIEPVWLKSGQSGKYQINPLHPVFQEVIGTIQEKKELFNAFISMIEKTVPVERLWLDTRDDCEDTDPVFLSPSEEVQQVINVIYQSKLKNGMSSEQAKQKLLRTEPFNQYAQFIHEL